MVNKYLYRSRSDKFMLSTSSLIIIKTSYPDMESARATARKIIVAGVAACVNVQQGITSFYVWQEQLEESQESSVMIKTTENLYSDCERILLENHPYDLPEIVSWKIDQCYSPYADWVHQQVSLNPIAPKDYI
jgi:periplasmic divalent cation tolerance protein